MISRPKAICPRCKGTITGIEIVDTSKNDRTETWYGECNCGAAKFTLKDNKVIIVIPCAPYESPDYDDFMPYAIQTDDPAYYDYETKRGFLTWR